MYETFILPVVLYAMDHVPIAQLQQATNLNPIEEAVKMRKLMWFGHVKRSSLPVKQVFEGLINNGNRGRGRPQCH